VDTSETRGGTEDLKALGNLAKTFVEERLPVGSTVLLRTSLDKKGKFGRILAEIHLAKGPGEEGFQEKTLNQMLLDENLGVRYSGQSKEDIINQHLVNVEHHRSQGNL
jgi:endonuclease YncB( thermonuclease family)|tara:strand:+ start:245 stop:568 length:324 start_codon:yes stop_codon:yes gene_type:complete